MNGNAVNAFINTMANFQGDGSSNVNMPDPSVGEWAVKLDAGGAGICTYQFTSDREPMWGDFYSKDGVFGGSNPDTKHIWATAWNTGFGTDPGDGETDFTDWIAVPNTIHTSLVPEPGLCTLGLAALVAGVLARRRTRKKDGHVV